MHQVLGILTKFLKEICKQTTIKLWIILHINMVIEDVFKILKWHQMLDKLQNLRILKKIRNRLIKFRRLLMNHKMNFWHIQRNSLYLLKDKQKKNGKCMPCLQPSLRNHRIVKPRACNHRNRAWKNLKWIHHHLITLQTFIQ